MKTKIIPFSIGQVVMTRGVSDLRAEDDDYNLWVSQCLQRYVRNDWGDLGKEDKKLNDLAINRKERILARYNNPKGDIYIITEWDRSYTTILFPSEY